MSILAIILPIFLAMGLGVFCRKRDFLSPEGMGALRKVAVNITLPAVSLAAYARAEYTPQTLVVTIWIFCCCCAALGMGFGAQRLLKRPGRVFPFLCTGFEGGMLGFALYPMLYGTLSPFALVVMGQVFFVFTVYKILLSGARGVRALLREAAVTPSLWALLAGLVLGAGGLYRAMEPSGLQEVFDAALGFLSAPTSFLILLTVGYDLQPSEIRWRDTGFAVASRLVIMGLLLGATLLLNRTALGGAIEPGAAVLLFLLPPPFVLSAFAGDSEERGFLSGALSVMTCLTILAFVGMVFIVR